MNQALFTMRRFLYAGTLALAAFTAGAVYMGFKFNMVMENNTIAMTQFLGSVELATTELNYLYDLAAKTPFEFPNLVTAARRFLAFGFSLRDTNRYLSIIGDTAAAFGGDAELINRMVLVFGQMRAAGRVLGQDLLQLQQIGINTTEALMEGLGLTREQLAEPGRLHIPSEIAIEAIMRYMNKRFHGLAAEQAKTFQGRISTLKDYTAQLFGTLTEPLYNRLRDVVIPQVTDLVQQMSAAAKGGGGMTAALGVVDARYGTNLVGIFQQLVRAGSAFWVVLKEGVLPVLKALYDILPLLTIFLTLLASALEFAADHTTLFKIALSLLIIEFVRMRILLILFGGANGRGGLIGSFGRGLLGATFRLQAWKNMIQLTRWGLSGLAGTMMGAYSVAVRGHIRNSKGQMAAMNGFQKMILRIRFAFLRLIPVVIAYTGTLIAAAQAGVAFLLTNPVGWIILAIAAVILGLIYLYTEWDWFHDRVNAAIKDTIEYIKENWRKMLMTILPIIGTLTVLIVDNFEDIKKWARDTFGWIGKLIERIQAALDWYARLGRAREKASPSGFSWGDVLRGAATVIPGAGPVIAGRQQGGFTTGSGFFTVGERGPEQVFLPAGSSVIPAAGTPLMHQYQQSGGGDGRPIVVQLVVDGKKLAEASTKATQDARARR
jgi:tape measure domain-containing protein